MADKRYDQQAAEMAAQAAAQGAAQARAQAMGQGMLKAANAATQQQPVNDQPVTPVAEAPNPYKGTGTPAAVDDKGQRTDTFKGTGTEPYKQSDAVTQAQAALDQIQQQKPQSFESKYGTQLDSIMQQILNPEKFKYDFNGDELFKYYADLYSQNGRQASMDAIGQASALTGGYGNSYAEQVGNQAYDEWMRSLYDKGMDLRDRAYQQYQDNIANQYNMYNVLANADQQDYDRYRDQIADWQNERGYYTDLWNNERNFDYGQYSDQRNFDYNVFSDQRNFDEQVRQFNENLNWDQMSTQQKYAYDTAMSMLQYGVMPSADMLAQAGISGADAQALFNAMQAQLLMQQGGGSGGGGGGGGGGGRSKKSSSSGDPYTYYTDEKGNYYTFDKKGNAYTVDPSLVNDDDIIDTSLANFSYNLRNTVNDLGKTISDQWNTSQTVNALGNAFGSMGNLVSDAVAAAKRGPATAESEEEKQKWLKEHDYNWVNSVRENMGIGKMKKQFGRK